MKCLYPTVRRREVNGSTFEVQYPCKKCDSCRRIRQQQVKLRILLESIQHPYNSFVTLTYNDIHCPYQLEKAHAQRFIKRYRKLRPGQANRYYMAGEYGSRTNRPHFHVILFGHSFLDVQTIEQAWRHNGGTPRHPVYQSLGFVHCRDFTAARAGYVAKYATKFLETPRGRDDGRAPEFATCSRGFTRKDGTRVRGIGLQGLDAVIQSIRTAHESHKQDAPLSEYFARYVGSIRVGRGRMSIDPYLRQCITAYLREIETAELEQDLIEYRALQFDEKDPLMALIREQRRTDLRKAVRHHQLVPKSREAMLVRNVEADLSDQVAKRKIRETKRQIKV